MKAMWYFEEDDNEADEEREDTLFCIIPEIEENDDFSDLGESIYEDSDDEDEDIDF